jgi:hypothetical protein
MGHPTRDVELCPFTIKSRSIPLGGPFKDQSQFKKVPLRSPESHSVAKEQYR